ncbi:hypothetical protein SNE40_003563 [Patella caerulea]|uniref:Uncharacterized protein n=1 Tax=Patella caerulea TaxID=87958 RepID=A0AAN8K854_PATCE
MSEKEANTHTPGGMSGSGNTGAEPPPPSYDEAMNIPQTYPGGNSPYPPQQPQYPPHQQPYHPQASAPYPPTQTPMVHPVAYGIPNTAVPNQAQYGGNSYGVPTANYSTQYGVPGQNTQTYPVPGTAGYNTTPLAYGHQRNVDVNQNKKKFFVICVFIVVAIIVLVIIFNAVLRLS